MRGKSMYLLFLQLQTALAAIGAVDEGAWVELVNNLSGFVSSYDRYEINFHFDYSTSSLVNEVIPNIDYDRVKGVILTNYDNDAKLKRLNGKRVLNVVVLGDPLRFGAFSEDSKNSRPPDLVYVILKNVEQFNATLSISGLNLFRTIIIITTDDISLYKLCYFCGHLSGKITPCSSNDLQPRTFSNFHGHIFKVTYIEYYPMVWCEMEGPGLVIDSNVFNICADTQGTEYELIKAVARKLNFDMVFVEHNHDYVGIINETGQGIFDIAMGGITLTADRAEYATFTYTHWYESYNALFFSKQFSWGQLFSFLEPLHAVLWVCIVGVCFLSAVFFGLFSRFELHKEAPLSFLNTFWECMRLFVDQQVPPKSIFKIRRRSLLLLIAWCIVCLNMNTAYKSKLLSTLLNPAHKEPQSLRDLVEEGYAVVTNSNCDDVVAGLLRFSHKIESLSRPVLLKTVCEEFDYAARYKAAVIDEYTSLQYEIRTTCEEEMEKYRSILKNVRLTRTLKTFGHGWALQKGVPFEDAFNEVINQVITAGLIRKWREDATRHMDRNRSFFPYSNTKRKAGKRHVNLQTLMSPFFVYLCGNALGLVVFLLEFAYHQRRNLSLHL